MTNEHLLHAFDRDLEQIRADVLRMGRLALAALDGAAEVLFSHDATRAQAVIAGDATIDAIEEAVGAEAARVIALHAPAASDLRMVLAILKMSSDLERAGDHAKTIARRSMTIDGLPADPEVREILKDVAAKVRQMLSDAMDAFTRSDADMAEEVRQRDFEVDELYNSFVRAALGRMGETGADPAAELQLQFAAKDLERIGDHATNLAEQVIYLATGQTPAEPRPKGEAAIPPQGD